MEKLLFIGPPGCGKGTQAKLLEKLGFVHFSSGDLIRSSKDPEVMDYVKSNGYVKGTYLRDETIYTMLNKAISTVPQTSRGYALDGFVRNLPQAIDAKERELIDKVIYFKIKEKTSIERRINRKEGRTDDVPDSMKSRLEIYKKEVLPIIPYLKKNFKFYEIDANPNGEEGIRKIHDEVKKVLKLD
ncbi:MAG: nucleoside monophosphate kinase [Nanoarchaeota archaeon]|nr:nucleoside monophosphate kinase [Nanoarchaeota archaeon]